MTSRIHLSGKAMTLVLALLLTIVATMGTTMVSTPAVAQQNVRTDPDEVATQQMPLYLRHVTRGIRPGRNEIESVNRPIECGGVLVRPGDVIVADGDGVIGVPREKAKEVAEYARHILEGDKAGRHARKPGRACPTTLPSGSPPAGAR